MPSSLRTACRCWILEILSLSLLLINTSVSLADDDEQWRLVLIETLKKGESTERRHAAFHLGFLEGEVGPVIAALKTAAKSDADHAVQILALQSLCWQEHANTETIALIRSIDADRLEAMVDDREMDSSWLVLREFARLRRVIDSETKDPIKPLVTLLAEVDRRNVEMYFWQTTLAPPLNGLSKHLSFFRSVLKQVSREEGCEKTADAFWQLMLEASAIANRDVAENWPDQKRPDWGKTQLQLLFREQKQLSSTLKELDMAQVPFVVETIRKGAATQKTMALEHLANLSQQLPQGREWIESNISPAIIERLADSHPEVRLAAFGAWKVTRGNETTGLLSLLELCGDSNAEVRAASQAFVSDSVFAKSLGLEQVVELQSNSSTAVRACAVRMLENWGDEALAKVVESFENDSALEVRGAACEVLGRMDGDPELRVKTLLRALNDPEYYVVTMAIRGLSAIGPAASEAAEQLIELVPSPSKIREEDVVVAIRNLGPEAKRLTPKLMQRIDRNISENRPLTIYWTLLEALGPTKKILPLVGRRLEEKLSVNEQKAINRVIQKLGSEAIELAPTLIHMLDPRLYNPVRPELNESTVTTLGAMGPAIVPQLMEIVEDRYHKGSSVAMRTLVEIGRPSETLKPFFQKYEDEKFRIQLGRIAQFGLAKLEIGEATDLGELESIVEKWEPYLGSSNLATVIADAFQSDLDGLLDALDSNQEVSALAMKAIVSLSVENDVKIARLRLKLDSPSVLMRTNAIATLSDLGGPEAIRAIAMGLRDWDQRVRRAAAIALVEADRDAVSALDDIIRLLEASVSESNRLPDTQLVENCLKIISSLGPEGEKALTACRDKAEGEVQRKMSFLLDRLPYFVD